MKKKRLLEPYKDRFLKKLEGQNFSTHTIKNYDLDLGQFESYISGLSIDIKDLSRDDIRNYLVELYYQNYSSATVSRKIASLKSFTSYLLEEKIITTDPMVLIESPKKEKKLPSFLFPDEIKAMELAEEETDLKSACIFELLYSTGMRVSELSHIKLSDINLEASTIKVFGKGQSERLVFLTESTRSLLNQFLLERKTLNSNEPYLFLNQKGKRLSSSSIWYLVKKIAAKKNLNKPVSPHTLRHSFASHLLDNGADIRSVQKLLGHKDLSTTQIYTHISKEKLKKVYDSCHPHAK